ncbi:PIN domain-containing protein [Candidatus Woesearchaeota archaeon]|nr:PIN domain-containing protein [Candidatus Woesearchaeota archaeon]
MIGLDSTFIIDFLRGDEKAVAKAREIEHEQLVVTPLNVFEVFFGVFLRNNKREEEIASTRSFFQRIEQLPITREAAVEAAKKEAELSKQGKVMEVTDVIIAMTYLDHGCKQILTRDLSFKRIKELKIVSY